MKEIMPTGFRAGDNVMKHQHGLWRHVTRHAPAVTWRRHACHSRLDNAFHSRSNGRSALVFRGFHTKRVAGVQKLSEVVIRWQLCAQFSVRHAETFSVRKKMAAIKFEINLNKKLHFEEGFGWVTKTLCTQKEANAFSHWNDNLGYQGTCILECTF
jgi:hypothetical protein